IELPNGWSLFQPEGIPWLVEVRDAMGNARVRVRAEKGWDATGRPLEVALWIDGNKVHAQAKTEGPYPIVVDPIWERSGHLVVPREGSPCVTLPNGKVLIIGGEAAFGEVFDSPSGTFTATNNVTTGLHQPSGAIPLSNGRYLIAGGYFRD